MSSGYSRSVPNRKPVGRRAFVYPYGYLDSMQAADRKAVDRRLARIEGQVRGVRRLLAEDAYCLDVLNQISAVSSALGQVSGMVAAQHVKHCIVGHGTDEAHMATKGMSRDEVLDELDAVFSRLMR